jgi:hypothetical protein
VNAPVRGVGHSPVIDTDSNQRVDTNYDLLDQLRREWRRLGRTPRASQTAYAFVARHPDLALWGVGDLVDLVEALDRRGGRTVEQRAAIVAALLADATDAQLHRALLQTLLPGVVSVCRQLRFGQGIVAQPSDALNEALVLLTELITKWAGQVRPYAGPDLLSALRGRLRRWLLKEKELRGRHDDTVTTEPVRVDDHDLLQELRGLAQGPHARMAALTYACVFENRPIKELAAAADCAAEQLQSELKQFALQFLL